MLKVHLDKNNKQVQLEEINVDYENIYLSSDSQLVSGYFPPSNEIYDGEIISVITPNDINGVDLPITIKNVTRSGFFVEEKEIPIQSITAFQPIEHTYKKVNLGNVEYNKIVYVEITKRYVQLPNGKIYYENYFHGNDSEVDATLEYYNNEYYCIKDENGEEHKNFNGYFIFDAENYITKDDETDTTKLDSISIKVIYYIENGAVTYSGVDYDFSENYILNDNGEIVLPIYDDYDNLITTLGNYMAIDYDKKLYFELKRPDDITLNINYASPAKHFLFINYKDKKYDFEFIDGIWQVTVYDTFCDCLEEEYKTFSADTDILTWDFEGSLINYESTINIEGEDCIIQNEYRNTTEGNFIAIYTAQDYILDAGQIINCNYLVDAPVTYHIYEDVNGKYYIIYKSRRVYLNESKVQCTISKYMPQYGGISGDFSTYKEMDEENDEILEEYDVTISESEYKKYLNGQQCKAYIIDDDGNQTPWIIEPDYQTSASSPKRDRAFKVGTIIEYDTNPQLKTMSGSVSTDYYKFNVYRTVTVNNVDWRSNTPIRIYDNALEYFNTNGTWKIDTDYCIKINQQEYLLQVVSVISPNYFICKPFHEDEAEIIYCESLINNGKSTAITDIDDLKNAFEKDDTTIVNEIVNSEVYDFFVRNNLFGCDEIPTAFYVEEDNVLDEGFLNLYKKINYYSIPFHFSSNIETDLTQEELLENNFYNTEKEDSINKIIDMEKDIYFPVIKNTDGTFTDAYKIKFNFHFRTRNLDTWKINQDVFSSLTQSIDDNLTLDNWNVIDNYHENSSSLKRTFLKEKLLEDEIFSSDLLTFLNFTEDDVFYQKTKLAKTFIRLSFYDSPSRNNQNLLYMSTIFLDENMAYKKYINNIDNETYKTYSSILKNLTTYCNVNSEPCSLIYNMGLILKKNSNLSHYATYWKGDELTYTQLEEWYEWFNTESIKSVKSSRYTTLGGEAMLDYLKAFKSNEGLSMVDIINATDMVDGDGNTFSLKSYISQWENVYSNIRNIVKLYNWFKMIYTIKDETDKLNNYDYDKYKAMGGETAYFYLKILLSKNNVEDDPNNYYCNTIAIDYGKDRLDCSFSVSHRDITDTSSDGFYIYMFKDYGYKLRPNDIYMKVEFNHAGEGKILQFFMPTKSEDKFSCMVNDSSSTEITSMTQTELDEFKKGIPMSDVLNYQYIKFSAIYDEAKHRYVYYVNPNYCKHKDWQNNIMTFNLWEIKFKDES